MWPDEQQQYYASMGYDVLGYDESGAVVVAPAGGRGAPGGRPNVFQRPGRAPAFQAPPMPFNAQRPGMLRIMPPGGAPQGPPPGYGAPPPYGPPPGVPMGYPLQGPPSWRAPILTPGVTQPFEGLVPLQLEPNLNNGVLTAAVPTIIFGAQPQKPFRGQRIVAIVNRSAGAAAVQPRIQGGVFVGTDLQAASFGDTPLETFGPTAFGVELVLTPAGPGISYRLPIVSVPAVPGGETVAISITILGRYIF